jgi:hydroxyacylglutathione hydrolase
VGDGGSLIVEGMSLEDHLGDILGKARAAVGLEIEEAAAAAGMGVPEYESLEESGQVTGRVEFERLAGRLGLDGRKLAGIASGWEPGERDLGGWRELRRLVTGEGGFTVNCYLVWDEVTREAALFDTGLSENPVIELIEGEQLQLRHVFITHSHYDHVEALGPIRQRFPKVRLHTSSKHAPVDQRNRATDFIHLGSLRITNRDTPGHADDGVTYVIGNWPDDAPSVAVVGDAIFAGSMGKAGVKLDLARDRVRTQILSLPPETLICPGHGPVTTVGEEREHNPFFVSC